MSVEHCLRALPSGAQVAEIWLRAPHKRNAVSLDMLAECTRICQQLATQSLTAVLLRAEGTHFCAGGDLRALHGHLSEAGGEALYAAGKAATAALMALPMPTIAVLNGPAVGGGAELALCTDFRIATPAALLNFRQTELGVTVGFGTTGRLVTLLGYARAARTLLLGTPVDAACMQAYELVEGIYAEGDIDAAALALCDALGARSLAAVEAQKRTLQAFAEKHAERTELERAAFVRSWASEDHAERAAAATAVLGKSRAVTKS
jgi:enoyl-CoA hydratase